MNYLYESERLGFIPIIEEYKNDYIDMYLNESIQQRVFEKIYNEDRIFYWVNINDLQNYKLLPNSAYELIKTSKNIKHIIEK